MERRAFLLQVPAWCLGAAFASGTTKIQISQFTAAGCCLTNLGLEGTLQQILDLGFAGVEIATFVEKNSPQGDTYPYAVIDSLSDDEKRRLKALRERFQHVTTHLPYYPDFRPIAADRALREKSRRELHRSIEDSGFWGAEVATVHVASEKNVAFRDVKSELVAFYRELADHAQQFGLRLGIETTPPYSVEEYLSLVEAVGRENVGGTVDTGHIRYYQADVGIPETERDSPRGVQRYNDVLLEVVKGLGPKLFHFHVNDVKASDWREHFVPGTGIVDWTRLLKHLANVGYRGLFAAEILHYNGPQAAGLRQDREFFEKLLANL